MNSHVIWTADEGWLDQPRPATTSLGLDGRTLTITEPTAKEATVQPTYPYPTEAEELADDMPAEAGELCLYIPNTEPTWLHLVATQTTVARHVARDDFDPELAVKAFEHVATEAAKAYAAEHGSERPPWHDIFSVRDRHAAAVRLAADFVDVLNAGPDYWIDLGSKAEDILLAALAEDAELEAEA